MNNKTQGFTLIEFMLSLGLGLGLLSLLMHIYIHLHQNKHAIQNWQHKCHSASVALIWLTREIRMAGFIGCSHLQEVTMRGEHRFNEAQSLIGFNEEVPTTLKNHTFSPPRIGEALCVQYANSARVPVTHARGDSIQCAEKGAFTLQDVLLISDCNHAETLQLRRFKLHHTYGSDANMGILHKIIYYVGKTNRKNHLGYPIYALYRNDLNAPSHRPTELVEGIEKLEIFYGILPQIPSASLQYVKSKEITHWERVRSVTVVLHPSSQNIEENTEKGNKLKALQKNLALDHPWQVTIAIRARG